MLFSGGGRAQMKAWKVHVSESLVSGDDVSLSGENVWYKDFFFFIEVLFNFNNMFYCFLCFNGT